ncbi:MAG: bifunctional 23S rRNA (guanine(2069)-N(7))-methyltransferase RlmK/23S rRNA (guanine(2445)-N(2))-methyltransferase RlmL, partial [Porticoccaceae bacterium]|nr:bifunctional 23S rRNA (guanine(2069)-N(7))-methyltransferase RlmK/23S rRNA (guanine(2445)-N(2))-methyltransferase RlmL [Porticoccaceae bacterium]
MSVGMDHQSWLATCPKGLELLLANELQQLGASGVKETVAAVHFEGSLELAYRACLWSRLANRILLPLHSFMLNSADDLYQQCNDIAWESHFTAAQSIAIDFIGTSRHIDNTMYGSQRVKDAVVDRIRRIEGERPDVDTKNPDIRIQVRQHKGRVTVSLDISGESLHRRGYRSGQGSAPIKENLAVALLLRAGWPEIASQGGALLDPMCGSGTLIIEGAMMAADIAPGILRGHYGFHYWLQHDQALWDSLVVEAQERKSAGLEKLELDIRGYDANPRVLEFTTQNIENAGLDEHIRLAHKPIDQFGKPTAETGLLLTNPPYGERLGEIDELIPLYQKLGTVLQKNFTGWKAAIFTGNVDLGRETDLSPTKQYSLFNGTIPCKLLVFTDMTSKSARIAERLSTPAPAQKLTEGARMVLNRLKKNQRRLESW